MIKQHPEHVWRSDEQLRNISLRLGALLRAAGAEDPGIDLSPMTHDWLLDLYAYEEAKLKAEEEAARRASR